jgi:tetratricopeptide (TPR) repeat protein
MNPVERRLLAVHQDWLTFAGNKQARLLYWQTNEADQRMIAVYIQRQEKLSSAVLRLRSAFDDIDPYSAALTGEIVAWYEAGKEGSAANGITADWSAPARCNKEAAVAYLLRLASSLMRHHPDVFPQLVLILEPERIRKRAAFERWLDTLLSCMEHAPSQAEHIRFVLVGTEPEPLPRLVKQRSRQVTVLQGCYRMQTLPRELAVAADQRGPGSEFQRLFVKLGETLERGDAAQLERLRNQALTLTNQQSWPDQSVAVHLLAGAAYLKWNAPQLALCAYEQATQAGRQALQGDHPAGNKLTINGLFGEATVYWMQGDYRHAAERYTQAAQFAEADNDGLLAVEAWRMCSVCFMQMRREEAAIDAGLNALDRGAWIPLPLRANSNLQMVAQQMLARIGILHKRRGQLTSQLAALYGEDWPDTIEPLPAEEATQRFIDELPQEARAQT